MRRSRVRRASAMSGQFAGQSGQFGQSGRRTLRLDTVVVVDSVMLRHHRSHDVTTYTMAIMNMVHVHKFAQDIRLTSPDSDT